MTAEWAALLEVAAAALTGLAAVLWYGLRGEIDRRFAEARERDAEIVRQLADVRDAVGRVELAVEREARLAEERFLRRAECVRHDARAAG